MPAEIPQRTWKIDDFLRFVPFSGFIVDYLRYALKCTDAPPLYHILSATTLASTAIAPNTDLVFQNEVHPLHLFTLLIGDSSHSRKTSAIKRCVRIAEPVFAKLASVAERLWWPVVSSPEGIVEELAKEPNRLMLLNEWTELHRLSSHAGYWKHSSEFFNLLYDANDAHRARSKGKATIVRPRVSILAASTKTLVESATQPVDWHGGKLARYLVGCAIRPKNIEMDAPADFPNEVAALRQQVGVMTGLNAAGAVSLSAAAWDVMREWRKSPWWRDLQARAPSHLQPSFGRADEHVFRVSSIYEATISYPYQIVVSPESMAAAIALVEWCFDDFVKTFAVVYEDKMQPLAKVANIVAAAGAQGITRNNLLRRTKLTSRQLTEAVGTLIERGDMASSTGFTEEGKAYVHYTHVASH